MIRQKIQKEQIIQTPIRDRLSDAIPDLFDNEDITNIPVSVVHSKESDKYIVTKNVWILNELVARGEQEILCNVTTEVDTDNEAFMFRAAYVLEDLGDKRHFDILEQCLCIHQCETVILAQNGENSVYTNGGDRRSDNYEKESLLDLICGMFAYKKVRIGILKRFAHSIGEIGIEGLYRVMCNNNAALTINRIHKKNSMLKNVDIIAKIKSLTEQGKEIDDIKRIIGMEIYYILFDSDNTTTDGTDSDNDSVVEDDCQREEKYNYDDGLELDADKNETQTTVEEDEEEQADDDEAEASSAPQINTKCGQLSESATEKVKSYFKPFFDTIHEIRELLDSKTIINEDDAGRLDTLITHIQKHFTDFMSGLYAELQKQ